MTDEAIIDMLERVGELFPQRPVDPKTYAAYLPYLRDLPEPVLQHALGQAAMDAEWFPTISRIRRAAVRFVFHPATAVEAWGEVRREIGRVGHSGTPAFSSDIIRRVVNGLGWRDICLTEDLEGFARRFERAYGDVVSNVASEGLLSFSALPKALELSDG